MAGSGTAHLRDGDVVLRVEGLRVEFSVGRKRVVHAVSDVSIDLLRGETLGMVGESGCGKTTTEMAIMQLVPVTGGSVRLRDVELTTLQGADLREARRSMQMIFQDPVSSLNPRKTIREIVGAGLEIWNPDALHTDAVDDMLTEVGLDPDRHGDRRPHEFSGGQCQRISIARALVLEPEVLICDEPVSSLDVSVQAQILNLMRRLRRERELAMLFVSHDLAVVKRISDRVAVMYLGKLCEIAPSRELFERPLHPYTRALLESSPDRAGALASSPEALTGEMPSPIDPPSGCRFRTRCPLADDRCAAEEPELTVRRGANGGDSHFVACHHA